MVKVVEVRKLRIFLFSKCEKGFEDKHWLSFLQVFFIIVYFTCALFRIEEWWRSELVEHKQNTAINFRQNSILVDSVIFFESVHLFLRFSNKLTRYEKMEIRVLLRTQARVWLVYSGWGRIFCVILKNLKNFRKKMIYKSVIWRMADILEGISLAKEKFMWLLTVISMLPHCLRVIGLIVTKRLK